MEKQVWDMLNGRCLVDIPPGGDVKEADGYTSQEFRGGVQVGNNSNL